MIEAFTEIFVGLATEAITKSVGPMARAVGILKPGSPPKWLIESLTPKTADSVRSMLAELARTSVPPHAITQAANALRSPEAQRLQRALVIATLVQHPIPAAFLRQQLVGLLTQIGSCTREDAEAISQPMTKVVSTITMNSVKRLRDESKQYYGIAVQLAWQERAAGYLENLEDHFHSDRQSVERIDLAELDQFVKGYSDEVRARNEHLVPQHFDTQTRVSMDKLYVAPRFSAQGDEVQRLAPMAPGARSYSDEVIFPLRHAMRRMYRTVVLGAPGAGKTTLTQKLMYDMTKNSEVAQVCLPFLVTLRKYEQYRGDGPVSFTQYIATQISGDMQIPVSERMIRYLLQNGRAIVIFDGLDELLQIDRRKDVVSAVESFARRYTDSSILVTSRIIGYGEAPLHKAIFAQMRLASFDEAAVAEYVNNWFSIDSRLTPAESIKVASSFLKESRSVSDLRSNPLLLSLMCNIYRGAGSIPQNRADLYERCATMLFEKWDESRGIRTGGPLKSDARYALQDVAYWTLTNSWLSTGIPERALEERLTRFLAETRYGTAGQAHEAAVELLRMWRGRAWVLTDLGSDRLRPIYQFTHRTFLEYFAATYIARTSKSSRALWRKLRSATISSQWDIVAQIAMQSFNDSHAGATDTIYNLILDEVDRMQLGAQEALRFACRNLDALMPSPRVMRRLVETTTRLLFTTLPNMAKQPRYSKYEYEREKSIPEAQLSAREQAVYDREDDPDILGSIVYSVDDLVEPLRLIFASGPLVVELARPELLDYCHRSIGDSDEALATRALLVILQRGTFFRATSQSDSDDETLVPVRLDDSGDNDSRGGGLADGHAGDYEWLEHQVLRLANINFWIPIVAGRIGMMLSTEVFRFGGLSALFNSTPCLFETEASACVAEQVVLRCVEGKPIRDDFKLLAMIAQDCRQRFEASSINWLVEGEWSSVTQIDEKIIDVRYLNTAEVSHRIRRRRFAQVTDKAILLGFAILLGIFYELEEWNLDDYSSSGIGKLRLGPFQNVESIYRCRYTNGDWPVDLSILDKNEMLMMIDWAHNRFNFVRHVGWTVREQTATGDFGG